jgi:hypothetical protein
MNPGAENSSKTVLLGDVAGQESGLQIMPKQCEAAGIQAIQVRPLAPELEVFPNPVRQRTVFRLMLPGQELVRASLHDTTGRQLCRLYEGSLGAGSA